MKRQSVFFFFFALALIFTACGENQQNANSVQGTSYPEPAKGQSMVNDDESAKNILQIAASSKDHTTLVAACQAAEIEDILVNAGPFTIFAPTNAAFEKLPAGTVETLLKPENKAKLKSILYYHASPGKYQGNLLRNGMSLYQAQGDNVKIEKKGDDVFANGNKILATIEATNGVIHVIDGVLLPPEK